MAKMLSRLSVDSSDQAAMMWLELNAEQCHESDFALDWGGTNRRMRKYMRRFWMKCHYHQSITLPDIVGHPWGYGILENHGVSVANHAFSPMAAELLRPPHGPSEIPPHQRKLYTAFTMLLYEPQLTISSHPLVQ